MRYIQLLLIAGLFVIWGCSSVSVQTDFDTEVDFSTYKTYMWYAGEMPEDDALSANLLVKKRVASGVEKALESKGYVKGSAEEFDFVVIIHAGSKEKMQVTSYGYGGYGYGRYGRGRGWGGGYGTTDVHYYDETTLIIDLVDAEKKELAWRGTGVGTVKEYSDQEEMQEAIDEVVAKILADFPPEK
jgi:hypothetical protein